MRATSVLRLGLYQIGAGMSSVLMLGVLNRVLRVEMGMSLLPISLMLGLSFYAGSLAAIPAGHTSDRHPFRGYHRTPYIAGGALIVILGAFLSPFVARFVASDPRLVRVSLGFIYFGLQGVATYVAGTAYLSLITDLSDEGERGRVVGMVWALLMVGILSGAGVSALLLREYSFQALVRTFALLALSVLALTTAALWRQERPLSLRQSRAPSLPLRQSLHLLAQSQQTRRFFTFLLLGLFFQFIQDVVLEPFGGEVLGLPVRETTLFNAYLMAGVLGGMIPGGMWLVPRLGKKRVTGLGAIAQALAFLLLAGIAATQARLLVAPAIGLLGLGMGLFTVGGVSLMMDMTHTGQTGLFVGAWTLAQAVARGLAAVGGGALHSLAYALSGHPGLSYALVFLVEGLGIAATLIVLARVTVHQFREEVVGMTTVLVEVVD